MLIQKMDGSGDQRTNYDLADPAQLARAQKVVEDHLAANGWAFKVPENSDNSEQIKSFDPTADTIVLAKPLFGG